MEEKNTKEFKIKTIRSLAAMLFHGVSFYLLMVVLVAGALFAARVYSQEKDVKAYGRGLKNVKKDSEIVLRFSTNMLKKTVQEGLSIEPKVNHAVYWNSEKELVIVTQEHLKPETEYQLKIKGAKSKWRVSQNDFDFAFTTPDIPRIKKIYPVDGQEDVEYHERIMIDFDKVVEDDYLVKIDLRPQTGFEHAFNEARTQLVVSPKGEMEKDSEYALGIDLQNKYHTEIEEALYEGTFKTKPLPIVVYNFDQNGEPLKTEERKEEFVPQIKEGKYIDIDISSQTLLIFEDSKELGAFKVSTGLRGMDTPVGTFKVIAKSRRPWSAKYKLYMPWFIQFTYEGHGIHELPEWPGGYKEGSSHLGIPVSHGCVRLGIGPAKVVYDFADAGIPVVIHL